MICKKCLIKFGITGLLTRWQSLAKVIVTIFNLVTSSLLHSLQKLASPTGDRGNLAVRVPAPVVPYVPPTPGLYGVTPLPQAEEPHLDYDYDYTTTEIEEQDQQVGETESEIYRATQHLDSYILLKSN